MNLKDLIRKAHRIEKCQQVNECLTAYSNESFIRPTDLKQALTDEITRKSQELRKAENEDTLVKFVPLNVEIKLLKEIQRSLG